MHYSVSVYVNVNVSPFLYYITNFPFVNTFCKNFFDFIEIFVLHREIERKIPTHP